MRSSAEKRNKKGELEQMQANNIDSNRAFVNDRARTSLQLLHKGASTDHGSNLSHTTVEGVLKHVNEARHEDSPRFVS
ncbi:hypothetical protein N7449_005464 [Penicillium cf. viridicatum]|uniref:Uncharacterized protein n=1 Tax=Penicillium cf. viridicatum TaxID=2972119 RepID=A0A9W9ML69_9EURO|nr:hypothetical protein N7449_005464 [Penicillium cf. viridicatum]